jgi:hypothetical protein
MILGSLFISRLSVRLLAIGFGKAPNPSAFDSQGLKCGNGAVENQLMLFGCQGLALQGVLDLLAVRDGKQNWH